MSDPRYDKVDPDVGLFRAPLASDLPSGSITASGGFGPVGVSLNSSGQIVIGTGGQSGLVGVLIKNTPLYPRLGNIPGQINVAVPIGGKAGNIVDTMTAGEITNMNGLTAGTKYYAASDGSLSSNPADGPCVGWTVEATRLVVRCSALTNGGEDLSGSTGAGAAVANTVTETAIQTYQLDANEVQAGSIYELSGWGSYSDTGTPTLAFTVRLGGIAGTVLAAIPAITLGSGVTGVPFRWAVTVNFQSATKAQASLKLDLGTSATTGAETPFLSPVAAAVTVDTTTAKTIGVDVTWGTASASNTLTPLATAAKRAA